MNRTPRLSKSGIEYLDYVWNFNSGCRHKQMGVCQVDNCWAEDIVNRFEDHYLNGFEPTFYPEAFTSPLHLKKPRVIGCAFMGDLFGEWVDPGEKFHAVMPSGKASITMSLKGWIFTTIRQCPQHLFLFKTKNAYGLLKWSPFPDNCGVGVTYTDTDSGKGFGWHLEQIEARIKFVSFEPLLGRHPNAENWDLSFRKAGINWVIIGAQTNPYKPPKIEWVQEIIEACDKAGIPVFLKDNLMPLVNSVDMLEHRNLWSGGKQNRLDFPLRLRQEMPGIH